MAKNKLSFDAIFEGNDIKEDAKKRISAMLEDVVATRMEAKDDEDKEDDDEKKMEAEAMDSEAEDKDADDETDPEVEDEEKDHEAKETPSQEKKEHKDGDEPKEEDEEVYEEGEDPTVDFKTELNTLVTDNDLKVGLSAVDIKPQEALAAMKVWASDLKNNKMAEPATKFFIYLIHWLAANRNADILFKKYVEKSSTSAPDPMMAAAAEPINNEYSEAFTNKLDKYLTYVAEEWAENNKIALENGIKVQIAESFLSNMKGMYEQYNFTNIPTRDMVVELGTKVTEAEQKLNEQIEKNAQLRSKYNKQRKEMVVLESSKGLTATQVEKFKKLTEDVAFEDEKSFKNKVAVIKENAFTKTVVKSDTKLETETGPQEELLHENTRMSKYVDTISRNLKY